MIRGDSLCRVIFAARGLSDSDTMRRIHSEVSDFISQHSDYEISQSGVLSYVDEEVKNGEDPSRALDMCLSGVKDGEPFIESISTIYRTYIDTGLFAVIERLHREHEEIELRVDVENFPDVHVTEAHYTFSVSALSTDTQESVTSFARFIKRFFNTTGVPRISMEDDTYTYTISVSSKTLIALSNEVIEEVVKAAFYEELLLIGCDVSHISRARVKNLKTLTPTNREAKPSSVNKTSSGVKHLEL